MPRYFYGFGTNGPGIALTLQAGRPNAVDATESYNTSLQFRVQTEVLTNPSADEIPSILSMSPIDRQQVTHLRGLQKVDRYIDAAPRETYKKQLADMFDKRTAPYWPNCSISVIYCEKSSRETAAGARELEDMYTKNEAGRKLNITMFHDAGHLVSTVAFLSATALMITVPLGPPGTSMPAVLCSFSVICSPFTIIRLHANCYVYR